MLFQNIAFAQLDVSQAITVSGNKDFYEIKDDQIYKISNTDDDTFQPPVSLFSTIELEDKYLSENITTPKDQKTSGDCWTFATCGAMETALIKNGYAQNNIDLSENHVKYIMSNQYGSPYGFKIGVGLGGIPPMYKSYLLYGPGLVNDDKCPHNVNDIKEDYAVTANYPIIDYMASGIIELPNLPHEYKLGYNETKKSRIIEVKKLIKEYGAVFASIYYDQSNAYLKDKKNFYYTANENGKYVGTNHTILLVGWDDNYSKENFNKVNGEYPAEKGAFIIKNSWGTDIGDSGLFYISYCDMYACEDISCISGVREKCGNESFNSYTGAGNVSAVLAFKDGSESYFNALYYGNIFKRNYADEKLKSVMLYLMPGYSYDVSVVFADEIQSSEEYVEFLGDVTEENLFSIECSAQNQFYTFNLKEPLDIPKDIYAIRVKIENLNGYAAVIPVEVPSPVVIDNKLYFYISVAFIKDNWFLYIGAIIFNIYGSFYIYHFFTSHLLNESWLPTFRIYCINKVFFSTVYITSLTVRSFSCWKSTSTHNFLDCSIITIVKT